MLWYYLGVVITSKPERPQTKNKFKLREMIQQQMTLIELGEKRWTSQLAARQAKAKETDKYNFKQIIFT